MMKTLQGYSTGRQKHGRERGGARSARVNHHDLLNQYVMAVQMEQPTALQYKRMLKLCEQVVLQCHGRFIRTEQGSAWLVSFDQACDAANASLLIKKHVFSMRRGRQDLFRSMHYRIAISNGLVDRHAASGPAVKKCEQILSHTRRNQITVDQSLHTQMKRHSAVSDWADGCSRKVSLAGAGETVLYEVLPASMELTTWQPEYHSASALFSQSPSSLFG